MSDQTDIIITDPAQWRAGDKVTIEGTIVKVGGIDHLAIGGRGPYIRSADGGLANWLRESTTTVTVRRPAPSLPDQPGDVFYATVNGCPNLLVAPSAARYLCIAPALYSGRYYDSIDIDPSTVRRVRLVPEDEQ